MRTIAEIDAEIAKVKQDMVNVRGTETEVYARIVGYYRSVRNWNKGKKEEFKYRKMFDPLNPKIAECGFDLQQAEAKTENMPAGAFVESIELFVSPNCPKCPKVRDYCAQTAVPVTEINVSDSEGFEKAAAKEVCAAPTAILYGRDGQELARASSVEELHAFGLVRESIIA
ncbi:hypothetical protein DWQ65_03865 [Treponema phagedenis]|uniref:Glutaredoxin domain-containing protein n=1 Tax=Treponema phagedenis TaxID=162 RepID=A0A0B7GWG2_TREPH|nr:anaerobic ribonucleoside-triphosphate reductase [Treponema phagedenis]EFW37973.1 hypothetical protein HMPREF9554_01533 [Treponema phagedenis F0421]NVP22778.1 hypothetical protein [Treponema phagedenis]QKS92505.1 hypothetical protein HPJ96_08085 [Treponema phagedenis]QLC57683.1 hypothetical protein HW453_01745 [Treponema phagedenis]QSH94807.1 hypothetical protein C5O78_07090 [Treponema phagedenis]